MRLASGAEARVSEVTDDWITIDANHRLAGKTLHYDVELLKLTKVPCPGEGSLRQVWASIRDPPVRDSEQGGEARVQSGSAVAEACARRL